MKPAILLGLILFLGLSHPVASLAQDATTDFQWITHGSNITQITTGARGLYDNWYGEATVGGFSAFADRENSFFLGLNLGYKIPLATWLYLGGDLGYRHVIPDGSENPDINTDRFFTLEARLKLEFVLGRHMSVFIGAGRANIYQGYSLGSDTIRENVVFWGVGLL